MEIKGRRIGFDAPPWIIAELSGNHNASLERALSLIDAAADAGVDAVKLQTYTADTMTLPITGGGFSINDPKSLWFGRSLHELYREAHTPWEWHAPIFEHARARGLVCFSSAFDETSVDFLESLDVPAYKIASFECIDLPLIRRVAATRKPLLISTGSASIAEIAEAVEAARSAGCENLLLFKCTTTYPASPAQCNLRTIPHLREMFGCEVGLSDHTLGIGVAVAGVANGAVAIEKHLTLSRADGGVDSAFSLEPLEFGTLAIEAKRAWEALGQVRYGPTEAEQRSIIRRRSLYIAEDVEAGDMLTPKSLRKIRPGLGLPPKYYDLLLGRRVNQSVRAGTPVTWSLIGALGPDSLKS